ncbi:MAG: L-seryl-tRNA(Sec) selenium transferase [Sulfobacillus thermosulfidooxidans]|uniref:L-seryl-tRNA(Sec) selenium transferase n=1 Tax=Sulfobacillus thermosulfidooxidans TaxID=28034 RepID=A0A2T2WPV6_SULTH|nr:MAG: L-seryl-tRNA(Sec) selenium transferase [Sulfobacillus thermosulfidooxidans]
MKEESDLRRKLPAVQKIWRALPEPLPVPSYWVDRAIDDVLNRWRDKARHGQTPPPLTVICDEVIQEARKLSRPSLRPVLNATGVMIHTNLGRSPLPDEIMEAVKMVAMGYSTLEYDLSHGRRGSRHDHVAQVLAELVGSEAAMVVNNNAAAVLIALSAIAHGKEVVVSRGELVEIGGSFRIPEVMALSGALLHEVGATNKTHARDYVAAINENTGLLLKVHQSNFRVIGFTKGLSTRELVDLGRRYGIPVMEDLGSGVINPLQIDNVSEPSVKEIVQAGVDIVTFSGDKLLGGPQAGIIVGKTEIIDQLKKYPLARAIRVDKMTLTALEHTIRWYLEGRAHLLPLWQMMNQTAEDIYQRARLFSESLRQQIVGPMSIDIQQDYSQIGGGSMPGTRIPTYVVSLTPSHSKDTALLERYLREADPPVIARISHGSLIFDLRTIFPSQESQLLATIVMALNRVQE